MNPTTRRDFILQAAAGSAGLALLLAGCGTKPEQTAAPATTKEAAASTSGGPKVYWICHGSEGLPIFTIASNAARDAAKLLGVDLSISFHHNDAASQKEAFQSAIAAAAFAIISTNPAIGVLREDIKLARSKGIKVITINTHDPEAPEDQKPDAYVGTSMYKLGIEWASYLKDKCGVKTGDKVWLPVEVPGATYETEESRGIKEVFEPLGITTELFDAGYDPSGCLTNLVDYLTAHRDEISGVVAMGDVVAEQIKPAFDSVGIKPGTLPVVGWGNALNTAKAVKEGYINAATWQFPEVLGYQSVWMAYQASQGWPINYDVFAQYLFTPVDVDKYIQILERVSK
jgi:simple sugar transport system substrate-binding protein